MKKVKVLKGEIKFNNERSFNGKMYDGNAEGGSVRCDRIVRTCVWFFGIGCKVQDRCGSVVVWWGRRKKGAQDCGKSGL
jgi:hypothetical protein